MDYISYQYQTLTNIFSIYQIASTSDPSSSFDGQQGMLNLQRSLTDLFGAGSETSTSMLLFAFLYMIKYPEVQKKIQEEIDHVVKEEGVEQVTSDMRNRLARDNIIIYSISFGWKGRCISNFIFCEKSLWRKSKNIYKFSDSNAKLNEVSILCYCFSTASATYEYSWYITWIIWDKLFSKFWV